jgi:hypothetical protein
VSRSELRRDVAGIKGDERVPLLYSLVAKASPASSGVTEGGWC